MKKIRLFCFPYAGGSATVYNKWKDHLDPGIFLCPIELPGRGVRIHEPFTDSIAQTVEDVLRRIRFELADMPFAFYGHSMGTLIAYELTRLLRERRYPGPAHIFYSGRGVPHIRRKDKQPYHTLPPDQFRKKVLELGGTPKEFFQMPELLDILLPILKNDFKVTFSYELAKEHVQPAACDISVLSGKDDDLLPEQIDEWSLYTRHNCTFHSFEGGHFFLHDTENMKRITKIVSHTLEDAARRRYPYA